MVVHLHHPETGGTFATVDGPDGAAQAAMYEARGWKRIEPAAIAAGDLLGQPVLSLDDLDDQALADVAVRGFIDVPADADRADLVAAIEGEFGVLPPVEEPPDAVDELAVLDGDVRDDEDDHDLEENN